MDRHEEIINGILSFPVQIMELVQDIEEESFITDFWSCIWSDFLHEKQTCTETWIVKASSYKSFNILLTHLSKAGWITSVLDANYAYITLNESKLLKWVTKEELIEVKRTYKFVKYRLGCTKSTWIDKVQLADKTVATGLIRKGFAKAGNNKFTYDVRFLTKYLHYVAINVCKGLTDSTKDVTYDEVIHELLNYYSNNDNVYTLGNNISDSRGRAIFQCMKKIFNPISCKDARALLVCEAQHLTEEGMNFVFASIAELLAYRGDGKTYTFADKIKRGMDAYDRHEIPNINLDEDSDELHVIIWLQRIYENLDNYDGTNWVVPVEIDATASMIQFIGVLTNDYEYMNRTNILGEELQDIWTVEGVTRKAIKKALTPKLYGSSQSVKQLWDKNKIEYTQKQLNYVNSLIEKGLFANANKFKEFIINNVKPETSMFIKIWNDEFYIECNRFKWEETTRKTYPVYTSSQGQVKSLVREVQLTPDVNQFKRYFVTLLIHNIDSQIANKVAMYTDWVIPIHDAFIVHPNDVAHVKGIYTDGLKEVYEKRTEILNTFFSCIGIDKQYPERYKYIENFEPLTACLK